MSEQFLEDPINDKNIYGTKEAKTGNQEPKSDAKTGRLVKSILDGSILNWENVARYLPFLIFLTFIALIYIANSYMAQKTYRQIELTKNEIKELRSKHIAVKSELMYKSKQTEVAKRVEDLGLEESKVPPRIIKIKK